MPPVPESLNARFQRLEPLIDRALELEGAGRERFLLMCADIHPDLIADLRRALAPDDAVLPALGELAAEVTRERPTDRRGLRAGPWRLLDKLGRGGMGTVYRAERADGAFDRVAAVKLLRGQELRFKEQLERERRVLARLDHPGIARLLDGGVLPDGQPYLVMELADGENLDVWLERARPSLAVRLRVFLAICEAVSYAHAVLVVHRDLKPSNIRVTRDGQVKLLDFGIAKLLAPDAERGSTQHLALTPDFAAPEQLQGGMIGLRTDVYALGALLFLLLTGRPPHRAFDGNWAVFMQLVTERDAPRMSEAAVDAKTTTLPPSILRGDLDAVVARALQRDPTRRYASVDAFAEDVRCHLDGRPVRARPTSWHYRFVKWLRRRIGVAVATGALVLALVAAITSAFQHAHDNAAERDAARLEATRLQTVIDQLVPQIRESTQQPADAGADRTADDDVATAERAAGGDPILRAHMLVALATARFRHGNADAAEALLQGVLQSEGAALPPGLQARLHIALGDIRLHRGDRTQACEHAERAVAILHTTDAADAAAARALDLRARCHMPSGTPAASDPATP